MLNLYKILVTLQLSTYQNITSIINNNENCKNCKINRNNHIYMSCFSFLINKMDPIIQRLLSIIF